MAAKLQNPSQHPLRANIPGRNDLEVLENLKNIIKSNQHDIYKPIPQPNALLAQYRGPIPPLQDKRQQSVDTRDARAVSLTRETSLKRGITPGASSGDLQQQQSTEPPRTALVHDLPPRPDQRPVSHANGHHPPSRTASESRPSEASQPYRYSDNHYSPPRGNTPEHYHRECDSRSSVQDLSRDSQLRDERDRSLDRGGWDPRRGDHPDYRERRDDRRSFHPRPPPEDRHYEPSSDRSAAIARRPSEDRRLVDNCYPPRDRRPSDGSRLSATAAPYLPPEDRSYRPTESASRASYSNPDPESRYSPPSNYDLPPARSSSTYDRDPPSASRSLDKRASAPTLEERLSAPRPSLQERIGPLSTPLSNPAPSNSDVRNSGGKQPPTLEQRLALPPPTSTPRSSTQQSQSHTNPGSSNNDGAAPSSSVRIPPPTGTPTSTAATRAREQESTPVLKRSPSPPASLSVRGATSDHRSQGERGPARQVSEMDVDKHGSTQATPQSKDMRETARSSHQTPQQASQSQQQQPPSTGGSATSAPVSVPPLTHAERRALALSREMQDALYKPPQHVQVTTTVDRKRDVYPDDAHRGRPVTWSERDREPSQSRGGYAVVDDRRAIYREPSRSVYDTPPPRPPPSSRDVYLDERDRSYHPPPHPDNRDYDRPRYIHESDLTPSHSGYLPPSSRVRPRSRSPIMDSRRSDIDMRPPPMKRPRDDMYSSQGSGGGGGSSYYPPSRDYLPPPPSSSSYYPSDLPRDVRPRDSRDYVYDSRGSRGGDGYLPRYEDERRYLGGPSPRS